MSFDMSASRRLVVLLLFRLAAGAADVMMQCVKLDSPRRQTVHLPFVAAPYITPKPLKKPTPKTKMPFSLH